MYSSFVLIASLAASVRAASHTVNVGKGGLVYDPPSTTAAVGDTVDFYFFPGDHDVVQGDYSTPCSQGTQSSGINSGFVADDSTFRITIDSTEPIWYFCSQISHCQSGMAGVINPPSSGDTLAQYIANAAKTSNSETPATAQGGTVVPAGDDDDSSTSSPAMSMSMAKSTSDIPPAATATAMSMSSTSTMPTDMPAATAASKLSSSSAQGMSGTSTSMNMSGSTAATSMSMTMGASSSSASAMPSSSSNVVTGAGVAQGAQSGWAWGCAWGFFLLVGAVVLW